MTILQNALKITGDP